MGTEDVAGVVRPGAGPAARRLIVTALALALLLGGSFWGDDDWFPFGPMSQFAGRIPQDSTIRDLWVEVTPAGQAPRRVDLTNADAIGLKGIELNRQLRRFTRDPQALGQFAQAWAQLHPDRPPLTTIVVGQDETTVRDARVVGRLKVEVVATWTAP